MRVVKNVLKKTRDKVFNKTQQSLMELSDTVTELRQEQAVLRHQTNEIREKVANSGAIMISENELLIKIFTGLKMYLDPRDLAITPHLALDGIWEGNISNAWLSLLTPTSTVLDIGSHNGYYGALAAQRTDKKNSKVVLFEVNPYLIPYIKKTLAVNWLNEQSVLENLAVADKPGKLQLRILQDYIGSSSVHDLEHTSSYMQNKMHLETKETVTVQAVAIDDYCKKHDIKTVDLAIMDIEGFEDVAYAGMRRIVKVSPNMTLFVEFTKDSYKKPKKFYDQMLADFDNVYTLDELGNFIRPKDASYESVIGDSDDWVMPVFSKNSNLAQ